MSELFKQLRAARKARGLLQEDVAQRAGVSRETYLRAESGQVDPRMSTFLAACDALDLDVLLAPRHLSSGIRTFLEAHEPPSDP
jgi:transcriptional regulator with XRE-family HTH domain